MAKKRINIVLLLLVLGLWGTVGYKTISQYFMPKKVIVNDQNFNNNIKINEIKKDTFELALINRDPFLNKQNTTPVVAKPPVAAIVRPKIITPPIIKEKPVVIWPLISYYGYIKSKEKIQELIMVKIDNRLYKLRKNDEVQGVVIKKVYHDSVEVYFNKETKVLKVK
jgi:hypothetical protein